VPGIQLALEKFFNNYGKTNAVRMRRIDGTKAFKVRRNKFLPKQTNSNFMIGLSLC